MEQQRAALRAHVVADEREQPAHHLARIVRRRVEREHPIDQIQRARLLAERLAAAMQLDVRLLELLHRGGHLRLHRGGAAVRLPRVLQRVRRLALQRDEPLGIRLRDAAARSP